MERGFGYYCLGVRQWYVSIVSGVGWAFIVVGMFFPPS